MAWGPTEWPRVAAGTVQGARPPFCWFLGHAGPLLLGVLVFAAYCLARSSPAVARTGFSSFNLRSNAPPWRGLPLPAPGRCPRLPPLLFPSLELRFLLESSRSEMGLFPCLGSVPHPHQLEQKRHAGGNLAWRVLAHLPAQ